MRFGNCDLKIVVTGGSGFIGSRICDASVEAGHETVSVSRRGETFFPLRNRSQIKWVSGNVFEPSEWDQHLKECDAVIHAVGIIKENRGKDSTFVRMNTESAAAAGKAAEKAGVESFVMVSVSGAPPTVPNEYTETKREGERQLAEMDFRLAVLRPGLIYGPGRWWSYPLRYALTPFFLFSGNTDRPLHVSVLGKAAVRAACDTTVSGILEVPEIRKLTFPD